MRNFQGTSETIKGSFNSVFFIFTTVSLNNIKLNKKIAVLLENIKAIDIKQAGQKKNFVNMMTRAFQYFALSKRLYNRLLSFAK